MKRGGKRGRLVGAGVAGRKGGDACVAHGGSCDAMAQQGEGDASVPTHRIRHPPLSLTLLPESKKRFRSAEKSATHSPVA